MTSTGHVRKLGGLLGILAVVVVIPAYLAGVPDFSGGAPDPAGAGRFVLGNGLPLHVIVFLLFLPALTSVIKSGTDSQLLSTGVLAGGIFYAALSAVGVAVEISFQATQLRFPAVSLEPSLFFYAKTVASWLFQYSAVGTFAMVLGTCAAAWYARVFPRWIVWAGVLVVLCFIVRFWYPLVGALATPAWILLLALLMLLTRPAHAGDV